MDLQVNARIRYYRKKKGFTQAELGKMLNMKPSSYSQLERRGKIDTLVLKKLAEILNVDARILLYGEIPTKEKPENDLQPKPNKPEIIIGYKYGDCTLSVMEMQIIKQIRCLKEKDLQQVVDLILTKMRKN